MSAAQIIDQLHLLNRDERQAVLERLLELGGEIRENPTPYRSIDLRERGIDEIQARDLRARLKTFAEDWDRPEAAIYDEDAPR